MAVKFEIFADNVAPTQLVPVLTAIQQTSGCTFNSIYRGQAAASLLHQLGKHTQEELYEDWIKGLPGYNPADRPGTSTHELCSDGVAYAGPVGRKLAFWQCGFDVNDDQVEAVIAAAAKHGWVAFQPYHSGSEFHHINLAKKPKIVDPFLPLEKGKSSPLWNWILRSRLRSLGWKMADGKGKLLPRGRKFDETTEKIVVRFQKEHNLTADGVVGIQTWTTIKKQAQAAKRKKKKGIQPEDV